MRDVYNRLSPVFKLKTDYVLKVMDPLYRLDDNDDYRGRNLKPCLIGEIGKKQDVINVAFSFRVSIKSVLDL